MKSIGTLDLMKLPYVSEKDDNILPLVLVCYSNGNLQSRAELFFLFPISSVSVSMH